MGSNTEQAIQHNCLALIVEATEVLDETRWKPWKEYDGGIDYEKLQEEIADCLAFVFNLAYEAGLSPQDLADMLYHKQDKNVERHP